VLKRLVLAVATGVLPEATDVEEGVFRVSNRWGGDETPRADIVFLHGIGGHPRHTWQAGDSESFWPAWLEDELPGIRVLTVGYRSEFTQLQRRGDMAVADRAINVRDWLAGYGIGTRPYAIIAHSTGGLIAKAFVIDGIIASTENSEREEPSQRPQGVLFLGTPHRGSQLADVMTLASGRLFSKSLGSMRTQDSFTADLHRRFLKASQGVRLKIYAETKPVKALPGIGAVVVPMHSAAIDGIEVVPLDRNHLTLPQCAERTDQLFIGTIDFVRRCLPDTPRNQLPNLL
jgi:protein SERAC1